MQTVAVLRNLEEEIELIPELFPGLKRLWFDIDFGNFRPGLSMAVSQSKRVEAYSHIALPRLIGVTIRYGESDVRNEGMAERQERALLSKKSL
jgi:hypothetical protein